MDIAAEVTAEVLREIVALGGGVVDGFAQYRAIRARMPIHGIEALAGLPQVDSIRPAGGLSTHLIVPRRVGPACQHSPSATVGVTGAGVRSCVLSDSMDDLAQVQATGRPARVTVLREGKLARVTGEGTAMLEIVHDLAPGATLGFATAHGGQAQFAQNILNLRNVLGCHVIVDDVVYFAEPAFQDGIIAQAVNAVVASGALYFSSAGNEGNSDDGTSGVWQGDFVPGVTVQGVGITAQLPQ